LHVGSLIALTLALVRELSGDASVDRAQQARSYACPKCDPIRLNVSENSKLAENPRSRAYVQAAEERFNGVNRCC
jgi:hypothetical protein